MDSDVFTAGTVPGRLQDRREIKILLCYLVNGCGKPIHKDSVVQAVTDNGFANFFDVMSVFAELEREGHVVTEREDDAGEELCSVTVTGKKVADQLEMFLPLRVKRRALASVYQLIVAHRLQKENKVEITEIDVGYNVRCQVSGGSFNLMAIDLYVPDLMSAMKVRENFLQNVEQIYKMNIEAFTKTKETSG